MKTVDAWLNSGKYLPQPLRDFHDQKDVFKAIDGIIKVNEDSLIKRPSWVEAQCYVIDTFLWFMARRGYTLQKTKTKLPFRDLEDDVAAHKRAEQDHFINLLTPIQADGKQV